jgi:hypothetical protein
LNGDLGSVVPIEVVTSWTSAVDEKLAGLACVYYFHPVI